MGQVSIVYYKTTSDSVSGMAERKTTSDSVSGMAEEAERNSETTRDSSSGVSVQQSVGSIQVPS